MPSLYFLSSFRPFLLMPFFFPNFFYYLRTCIARVILHLYLNSNTRPGKHLRTGSIFWNTWFIFIGSSYAYIQGAFFLKEKHCRDRKIGEFFIGAVNIDVRVLLTISFFCLISWFSCYVRVPSIFSSLDVCNESCVFGNFARLIAELLANIYQIEIVVFVAI